MHCAGMGAYQNGWILTAETIQGWAKVAQQLEIDLAQAEEGRRYNSQVIDQRNAEIGRLNEELRIQKLETLAAHGRKRDADTAWQKEVDQLRSMMLPQPQTITAGGVARGCGGAGLQQHNDRDTMKRALTTALSNGTWLSSELLVDAVLMELFPQPGKRLEDIPVPQATRPAAALSFEEVTEPVIEWLNAHHNPHTECRIEVNGAWLLSTETCHPTNKFIKD